MAETRQTQSIEFIHALLIGRFCGSRAASSGNLVATPGHTLTSGRGRGGRHVGRPRLCHHARVSRALKLFLIGMTLWAAGSSAVAVAALYRVDHARPQVIEGPAGPQGEQGPAGPPGSAGPAGLDGSDGINGTTSLLLPQRSACAQTMRTQVVTDLERSIFPDSNGNYTYTVRKGYINVCE